MENKVIITSDSTTDLPVELREKYNIGTIPLTITLGEKSYRDGVDINPDFIYEYVNKNGDLPKTAAVNIADTEAFFKTYTDKGYSVVHFSLSSEMSSTYNNCVLAAEELENVYVVDTKNLSSGGGLLVVAAAEMAMNGMSAKEIAEKSEELVPCVDASFIIDNLEYLHKGGRCSAIELLGANILKIKPSIEVTNGTMGMCKKYRGKFENVALEYAADRLENIDDICLDRVFVTHAGLDKEFVDSLVNKVKECAPFKEVIINCAGCTISSHCGRDCCGVLFIRKSQKA